LRSRGQDESSSLCNRTRIVTGNTYFPIPNRPSRRGFTMPVRGAHARGTVASWGFSGLPGSAVPEGVDVRRHLELGQIGDRNAQAVETGAHDFVRWVKALGTEKGAQVAGQSELVHPVPAQPPARRAVPHAGKSHRRDRLRGWTYRIRTSMCREKIHLFEHSAIFGFV
jgi:hypothetical protein